MKLKKITFIALSLIYIQTSYGFETMLHETVECSKIMALSVATAVTYGIINDQVTVRICPEYFNKGFHGYMVSDMYDGLIKQTLLLSTNLQQF